MTRKRFPKILRAVVSGCGVRLRGPWRCVLRIPARPGRALVPLLLLLFAAFSCLHPGMASAGDIIPPALVASPEEESLQPLSTPAPFVPLELSWTLLRPGLEFGAAPLAESERSRSRTWFVVLRIDPAVHGFSLSMASEAGRSFSLADWCRKDNLLAGINAAMYLPDNRTSTGYMRSGAALNNSNLGGNLGAFFVAGPRKKGLASADILERSSPGWPGVLDDYDIVVQNYRFINSEGRLLWREGGPLHSIAVVAKDRSGRILFVLCQEPLSGERFAAYLRNLPLDLSTVMYVEGGAQAGMFVRVDAEDGQKAASMPGATIHAVPGGVAHVWKGRQSLLNTKGNPDAALPNLIGVKIR